MVFWWDVNGSIRYGLKALVYKMRSRIYGPFGLHSYLHNNASHLIDKVEVPERTFDQPLRLPVSNVFRGQSATSSGLAIAGRLCSGVVQVGETVLVVPGNQTAAIRSKFSILMCACTLSMLDHVSLTTTLSICIFPCQA